MIKVLWTSEKQEENSLLENARLISVDGEKFLEVFISPKTLIERIKGCIEILTGKDFVYTTIFAEDFPVKG